MSDVIKRIADERRSMEPSEEDRQAGVVIVLDATLPNPVSIPEHREAVTELRGKVGEEGTAGLSGDEQVAWQQEVASREAIRRFRRNLPRLLVAAASRECGTLTAPRTSPRPRNPRVSSRRRATLARSSRGSPSGDADSDPADLDLLQGAVA